MGRPLTGSVRRNKDGTVTVELPLVLGGRRAPGVRFSTFEQAENWRLAAVAALLAGRPRPNPEPFQRTYEATSDVVLSGAFAEVALAWWGEHYDRNVEVSVDRAEAVLGIINRRLIPFFGSRASHVQNLQRRDGVEYVRRMAGFNAPAQSKKPITVNDRLLTKLEAAQWTGASKSQVTRAWLAGKFPHAQLDTSRSRAGLVRIPISDLLDAGFTPKEDESPEVPLAYTKSMASGDLAILRNIMKYAQSLKLLQFNPFEGIVALKPAAGAKTHTHTQAKLKLLDLTASKSVAANMNIHNQLAFWLCRCLGLRISEAFGVHLDDIFSVEGRIVVRLHRQGGRWWKVCDTETGEVTNVSEVERMKTDSSMRSLPIPRQLASFIETYIAAYHENSLATAPLILTTPGAGRSQFSYQLKRALDLVGLSLNDIGYSASPHFWRKCFTTDMKDRTDERARSMYCGHKPSAGTKGGAIITDRVYTLDQSEVKDLVPVAVAMETLIDSTITSLVTPRPASVVMNQSTRHHRETDRAAYDVLDAAGFFAPNVVEGEEVIDFADASELLGLPVRAVVRLVERGILESRFVRRPTHRSHHGVLLDSITKYVQRQATEEATRQRMWSRRDVCDELDVDYMTLHFLISRLGIKPTTIGQKLTHLYDETAVGLMRAELALVSELTSHSVTVTEAAKILRLNNATVVREVKIGRLSVDEAATSVRNLTMVTRESVDHLVDIRSKKKREVLREWSPPPGTIPIAEAQELSGLKRMQLLVLARQGVVFYKGPDYSFYVDEASLKACLGG